MKLEYDVNIVQFKKNLDVYLHKFYKLNAFNLIINSYFTVITYKLILFQTFIYTNSTNLQKYTNRRMNIIQMTLTLIIVYKYIHTNLQTNQLANITTMTSLSIIIVVGVLIPATLQHGRLMKPVQRSSMWRKGFPVPENYNDNELFCGGRPVSSKNSFF